MKPQTHWLTHLRGQLAVHTHGLLAPRLLVKVGFVCTN